MLGGIDSGLSPLIIREANMLLKLLDRSDIIRYGKTVVEIPNHIAENLVKAKRAVVFVGNVDREHNSKIMESPPMNKMMWVSPEKKAMDNMTAEVHIPFPGINDRLFPEHIIGR
jgi:hypothetical protein